MRSPGRVALVLALAATGVASAAAQAAPQRLVLDARFTSVEASGPDDQHAGHRQIVAGVLRDAGGKRAGRFKFTCTWTAVVPSVREQCVANARTPDGTLQVAGPATPDSMVHEWIIARGTGAFRRARGLAVVRDLGDRESLVTITATTRRNARLHAGLAPVEPRNAGFAKAAEQACRRASKRLAALPAFPFPDFDPLRPDPALLPRVGAFFTGPGDPRPALQALDRRLRGLGRPPALRTTWNGLLEGRAAQLRTIQAQDRAALAGDVPAFVRTVRASSRDFRAAAIHATVFDAPACVI